MKKNLLILLFLFNSVAMFGQMWAVQRPANDCRMKVLGDTIWMTATSRGLIRSFNSGINWDTIHPKVGTSTINIGRPLYIIAPKRVVIADGSGNIYLTVDDGATWTKSLTGFISSSDAIENFYFLNASVGYAVGGSSGAVFKTTNGGTTFTKVGTTSFQADNIIFRSTNIGYAMGSGIIAKSTDGGATWTNIYNGNSQFIYMSGSYFFDNNKGFVAGTPGILLRTIDGGIKWDSIKVANYGKITSIKFKDVNNGWLIENDGSIFKTSDGGNTWVREYVEKAYNGGGVGGYITADLEFSNKGTGWAFTEGLQTLVKYYPNAPILVLTQAGAGVGINATYNLGTIYSGDSVVKKFEIANVGNLPITFAPGEFKLTGETNSYLLISAPTKLAVGEKDTFTVILKPKKIGLLNSLVSIKNGITGSIIKFNFTGTFNEQKNLLFHYTLYSDFKDTSGLGNDALPNKTNMTASKGLCIGAIDTSALRPSKSISFAQSDFTFAGKVKLNPSGNDFHTIASESKLAFFIGYKQSKKSILIGLYNLVYDTKTSKAVIVTDTISIAAPELGDGKWHDLAISVYSNYINVYLDKSAIKSVYYSGYGVSHTDIRIGQKLNSKGTAYAADSSLNGCISDIRWYNKGLTPSEISKLYPAFVDQYIASATSNYSSVQVGSNVSLTASVNNLGNIPAVQTYLGYYLSSNEQLETTDIILDSSLVAAFTGTGTQSVNKLVKIPMTVTPGTYYILVVADKNKLVTESNENNNSMSLTITITGVPDLIVESPSCNTTSTQVNSNIQVSCSVKNQGNNGLSGTTYLGYYLSSDKIFDQNDLRFGYSTVSSIAVNSSATFTEFLQLPTVGEGDYYILFVVDYYNFIFELNELNNVSYIPIKLTQVTGIDDIVNETAIKIYPNPTQNMVMLSDEAISAEVYNTKGELVIQSNEKKIDVHFLPNGTYTVVVNYTKDRKFSHKLVKE